MVHFPYYSTSTLLHKVMETKLQKALEETMQFQKEKETLQEELNEKERQANSQELVCLLQYCLLIL